MRAFAFVAAVDDSNAADAKAVAIDDLTAAPTQLVLRDRAAGFAVATTAAGGAITFTITGTQGADETASLEDPGNGVQALPLAPDPQIVAGVAPLALTLHHLATGTSQTFTVFADYVTALNAALGGAETVRDVVASGAYASLTNVLAATDVTIVLQ